MKRGEAFRFANQNSEFDKYYFDKYGVMKIEYSKHGEMLHVGPSSVSLNWLLSLNPKKDIFKVEENNNDKT